MAADEQTDVALAARRTAFLRARVVPRHRRTRGAWRTTRRSLVASVVATVMVSGIAFAYWTAGSVPGGNGAAAAAGVNAGSTPTATASGSTVTVSWTASTLTSGQAVNGYIVKRYSGAVTQTILSACSGTVAATSCVESSVPIGTWTYSVTPVFAASWQGAESARSAAVAVTGNPVATADGYPVAEDTTRVVARLVSCPTTPTARVTR